MAISENLTAWAGKTVVDWTVEKGITDPANTAYRIRTEYEGTPWDEVIVNFLADPKLGELESLVIGAWDAEYGEISSVSIVETIVGASPRMPNLTSLFFGDITYEENEISWIQQSDLSPFFGAFPKLEHLGIRGATQLSIGTPRHPVLKTLIIESGGLPYSVIEEVIGADLPELEHLELWLGAGNYGAEATVENLQPIFEGNAKWPKLKYLGLRDSEIADGIAAAITTAPILSQIEVLDLSLGNMSDEGATALAESPAIAKLKKLDIHHHYVSEEVVERLKAIGTEVNADDVQKPYTFRDGETVRYVSVSE